MSLNGVRVRKISVAALMFGMAALSFSALAQPKSKRELIKAINGCSLIMATYALPDERQEVTWDGECVNGLAEGPGTITVTGIPLKPDGIRFPPIKIRGTLHKGAEFGYALWHRDAYQIASASISEPEWNHWIFNNAGHSVAFSGDLGLTGHEALLASGSVELPKRSQVSTGSLSDGTYSITVTPWACNAFPERFPECAYRANRLNPDSFRVYGILVARDGQILNNTLCPEPRNLGSCGPAFASIVQPQVENIEKFITSSADGVRETTMAMRAALAERLDAQRIQANRRTEEAQRLTDDRAAADAAFNAKLDAAPVGQLFSMADEAASKGDLVRARQALRKLLARFPDHSLATVAASMLSQWQGK